VKQKPKTVEVIMLNFQIEFSSGLSVYRQLAEQIRYYVASGTLMAEDKLPSVRGLAKELRINPATVVKAYNILQNEGLVELRQGRGAFVTATKVADTPATEDRHNEVELKAKGIAVLAHRLGLSESQLQKIVSKHYKGIKDEHTN